ncbi:unnamed protein product [Orchesella dallaii]|uniref:Uncharacterized protein n=1 Tax=Orchesella dallaii TaxID=48710 RepID=A0ABP1R195_9HEXA
MFLLFLIIIANNGTQQCTSMSRANAPVEKLEEELRAKDTIIKSMQKDPMVVSLKAKDLEIRQLQEQLQDREAEIELVNMKILYNKYLHNKNGGRCLLKLGHARSRIIDIEDNVNRLKFLFNKKILTAY